VVRRRSQGQVLFITLVVLVLVASAIGLVATHYGLRARLVSQESRRIHLNALTDAAIAESLGQLAASPGFAGVPERPFGGGTFSSEVRGLSGDRLEILATASYRGWRRTVRVCVEIEHETLTLESWAPAGNDDT